MSKLRRYFAVNQTCVITIVTAGRRQILVEHMDLVHKASWRTQRRFNVQILAWVVMPDHLHAIVHAPQGDFSAIIHHFKLSFSRLVRLRIHEDGAVWQRRFYDHIVRSELEILDHVDYLHNNPVRHGYVGDAFHWKYSSLTQPHRFRNRNGNGNGNGNGNLISSP